VRHTDLASFLATLAFGPAQTCRNLTVVPILSADRDPSRVADPRRGLAEVTEVSEQGEVPLDPAAALSENLGKVRSSQRGRTRRARSGHGWDATARLRDA
jgi:hypothetical protein